jgi:6,7-dimethyl-8-ribityllumazine synthase
MHVQPSTPSTARGLRIGIAVSRYHAPITEALRDAAVQAFLDAGGKRDDLLIVEAPGAYELVAICNALARRPHTQDDLDAVVALGCVITGETRHDEYICNAVSTGLAQITIETGVPVSFGVLTCGTMEQAMARASGDKGNKGAEAMTAAIETVHAIRAIGSMKESVL